MRRVIVFGNSGSGKSSLAAELVATDKLAHLDLDILAWQPTTPPQRIPLAESAEKIEAFMQHDNWVIEGCYADLLEIAASRATELIYLDLDVEQCIENAHNRPWEPHKYASKEDQDDNLDMLVDWISDYPNRDDVLSRKAHQRLFETFPGLKTRYTSNSRD
ncbi:MAG: AAA family ATPase [Pseudohongiellaceae bacterium]